MIPELDFEESREYSQEENEPISRRFTSEGLYHDGRTDLS
jgi:hypothetical protein